MPTPAPTAPPARPPTLAGRADRRLAAALALPLVASAALLAVVFGSLAGDQEDGARATASLDHAARQRDVHLAALEHRDAIRALLGGSGTRRDLEAAAVRLTRAAEGVASGAATDRSRPGTAAEAVARALDLGDRAAGRLPSPGARAQIDDLYAREALAPIEDAARDEAGKARRQLAAAQHLGRRRLLLGGGLSILSVLLAVLPALLLARRTGRAVRDLARAARRIGEGQPVRPVEIGEGELRDLADAMNLMAAELELTRDRERLVALAEARIQALEEGRADLEQRVEERTRALARANADLSDNLHRLAEAQQRLLVSDRMAAIGQLAAAVAHEVNNPIASIGANLRFLAEEVRTLAGALRSEGRPLDAGREAEIASAFGDAREAAQRVSHIVRDLGTIARGEEEELCAVDLREPIEVALNVAQAALRRYARVDRQLDEVPAVRATASRLGQVFLPILLRAGRAIAARGPTARGAVQVSTWTDAEGQAVAEIRDDGAALSPEAVAHLFDPFGPLAAAGPAAGLGLAVAHGVVSGLGGTIEVTSGFATGTAVRVTLPPAPAARRPAALSERQRPTVAA